MTTTVNTWRQIVNRAIALANEGKHDEGLHLLETEAFKFTSAEARNLYLKANLLSRTGRKKEAIETLETAKDRGYWYPGEWLTGDDPDLKHIADMPEFQRLRDIFVQRSEIERQKSQPDLIVRTPEDAVGTLPLLIALHGNAQNAELALQDWQCALDEGWIVAVPQSSQIFFSDGYVWNDYTRGEAEVKAHYAKLIAEYAVDPMRVVIAGFSMGAGLAAKMALSQDIPARGLITVGAYLPDEAREQVDSWLDKAPSLRGYIFYGEQDNPEFKTHSETLVQKMQAQGIESCFELLPGIGHTFPADFPARLSAALNFITQ